MPHPHRHSSYNARINHYRRSSSSQQRRRPHIDKYHHYNMLPNLVIVTDLEGTILYVNRHCHSVFGFHRRQLVGQNYLSLLHADDLQNHTATFASYGVHSIMKSNHRIIHKQGRSVRVQWTAKSSIPENMLISTIEVLPRRPQPPRGRANKVKRRTKVENPSQALALKQQREELYSYLSDALYNPLMELQSQHNTIRVGISALATLETSQTIVEPIATLSNAIESASVAVQKQCQVLGVELRQEKISSSNEANSDATDSVQSAGQPSILPEYIKNKSYRVLIVDDNLMIRSIVKRMFNDSKFTIDEAKSGEEAVEAFQKGYYDIIFMDINMPGKYDGLGAVTNIRCHEEANNLFPSYITMLTSTEDDDSKISATKCGANGYLTKPLKKAEFIETIIQADQHKAITTRRNSRAMSIGNYSKSRAIGGFLQIGHSSANQTETAEYVARLLEQQQYDAATAIIIAMKTQNWQLVSNLIQKSLPDTLEVTTTTGCTT